MTLKKKTKKALIKVLNKTKKINIKGEKKARKKQINDIMQGLTEYEEEWL